MFGLYTIISSVVQLHVGFWWLTWDLSTIIRSPYREILYDFQPTWKQTFGIDYITSWMAYVWVSPLCIDAGLTFIQSEKAKGEAKDLGIHRLVN